MTAVLGRSSVGRCHPEQGPAHLNDLTRPQLAFLPFGERHALDEGAVARAGVGDGCRAVLGDRQHEVLARERRVVECELRAPADAVRAAFQRDPATRVEPAEDDELGRPAGSIGLRVVQPDLVAVAQSELRHGRVPRQLVAMTGSRGGGRADLGGERREELLRGRVAFRDDAQVAACALRPGHHEPDLDRRCALVRGHEQVVPNRAL